MYALAEKRMVVLLKLIDQKLERVCFSWNLIRFVISNGKAKENSKKNIKRNKFVQSFQVLLNFIFSSKIL